MAEQSTLAGQIDFGGGTLHTKQRGLWSQAFQRLIRNRLAAAGGIILLIVLSLSILAQFTMVVGRHDPAAQDYSVVAAGPSADHWLGTDPLGRDMWARLLDGTLFSLKIGFGAEAIVLVIGISVGMAAALAGKRTDAALMWLTDLAYAFPDLLMIILFRQILVGRHWPIVGDGNPQIPGLNSGVLIILLAISFVSWVTIARVVRGQMLSIKNQDYVMAAECVGASRLRIVRIHMLPNTLSSIVVASTFGIPTRIFAEAALAFIGLGVAPPASSLGSMISDGYAQIVSDKLLVIWPAIVVASLMLCFTFLGDGLRDALDPRTRK
ncbi:MAG: ABC transporter permease [Tepidiformaceae bacterium]